MKLTASDPDEVSALTAMSKAAFDSDCAVGASSVMGPPEYDNVDWHRQMQTEGHLFSAYEGDALVGGALLFRDAEQTGVLVVGRIFIDVRLHRKGLGIELMREVEQLYADVHTFKLDTPLWNTRTNRFYQKLGYTLEKQDRYFAYYTKTVSGVR